MTIEEVLKQLNMMLEKKINVSILNEFRDDNVLVFCTKNNDVHVVHTIVSHLQQFLADHQKSLPILLVTDYEDVRILPEQEMNHLGWIRNPDHKTRTGVYDA